MTETNPMRVDIVSDVVCPWCIVGFLQLRAACNQTGIGVEVHWHPFELNPDMAPEGQNLREHLAEKYGVTAEQSAEARGRLGALGESLNFTFNYPDTMLMYNTFLAHQLIRFANDHDKAHQVKMALFIAHFTDNRPIGEIDTLVDVATSLGLDGDAVRRMLSDGSLAETVREEQAFWTGQGITGVPAMVFERKYLVTGAQGVDTYSQILQQLAAARAA